MTDSTESNTNAREEILGNIRSSLGRGQTLESTIQEGLRFRINDHGVHVQPKLGKNPSAVFVKKLKAAEASVTEVRSMSSVGGAISKFLKDNCPDQFIVTSADPLVSQIKWPKSITAVKRVAQPEDHTSVTAAQIGVAETGTLVLVSGIRTPTTLNFLPENHIVILQKSQIVRYFEEAWRLLREQYPQWPRTVNLISGPSKTADVEQTIQLGVHGPRQLLVVLVGA